MKPIIQCSNLIYYPPSTGYSTKSAIQDVQTNQPILRNLSLSIAEGEFLAIIGANGSGKTTLARHFNSLLTPTTGQVLVEEMDTRQRENIPAIRRLVGMVLQSPEDQMVAECVEAEVAFGVENLGLGRREINERVDQALHAVDMEMYRQRPTFSLSAGQMQRVAIAGVLAMQPKVIVFDESTAMLDPAGRNSLMAIMRRLNSEGITIVLITHFMDEAAQAGRIIVLDSGAIVMDGSPVHIFSDESSLKAYRLGLPTAVALGDALRSIVPDLPARLVSLDDLVNFLVSYLKMDIHCASLSYHVPDKEERATTSWMIAAQHLGHTYLKDTPLAYRALEDVSMQVTNGSVQGLAGATGSGKSTLLQHFNGLILPQEGSLQVAGFDLCDAATDLKALRRQAGMAFQMPEMYFFEQYVGDEVAYGLKMMGITERAALRAKVKWGMESAGLDFDAFVDRLTFTLSSGEKRKVALACVLALEPQLLLLDEPTAGLDPAAHAELINKLLEYHGRGITIILSSHQIEDLAVMAQSVSILNEGRVVLSGQARGVLTRAEVLINSGLEMPVAAQAAHRLRTHGIGLPEGIITSGDFVSGVRSFRPM